MWRGGFCSVFLICLFCSFSSFGWIRKGKGRKLGFLQGLRFLCKELGFLDWRLLIGCLGRGYKKLARVYTDEGEGGGLLGTGRLW